MTLKDSDVVKHLDKLYQFVDQIFKKLFTLLIAKGLTEFLLILITNILFFVFQDVQAINPHEGACSLEKLRMAYCT